MINKLNDKQVYSESNFNYICKKMGNFIFKFKEKDFTRISNYCEIEPMRLMKILHAEIMPTLSEYLLMEKWLKENK